MFQLESEFQRFHLVGFVVSLIKIVGVLLEPLIGVLFIKHHTRLKDINERIALVLYSRLDDFFGLHDIPGKNPRHKGRPECDGSGQWIERLHHHTPYLHWCLHAFFRRRRSLPLSQPIHHVVVHDVGDIRVATNSMEKMIATLTIGITIPRFRDDGQLWIGNFDSGRGWQCPAMETVEIVHT